MSSWNGGSRRRSKRCSPAHGLVKLLTQPCALPRCPCSPRSAVSGRGVTELVRGVRALLDTLPEEEAAAEAGEGEEREQRGAAPAALPGRRETAAKIGEFTIEADLAGPRVWFVQVGRGCLAAGVLRRKGCSRGG